MDDTFAWGDGPLTREQLDLTIRSVQERLDLLAVLRTRYGVQMSEAGERWRGLCFLPSLVPGFKGSCAQQDAGRNKESPRNLWVSDGDFTRVWRCHSCKRRGDVIDLIEHADDLPREGQAISLRAVRVAAKLSGVAYLMDGRAPDERDEPSDIVLADAEKRAPRPPARVVDFDQARQLNVRAASYWAEVLNGPRGAAARDELARRGITDAQIGRFKIGYAAAEWRDLAPRIRPAHVADAVSLGLVGRNRHGDLYDRQRDRIIFPYCTPATGSRPAAITGFAGRKLVAEERAPKWLNSNNAPGVWEKSSALFGLYQAQARARELGRCAVVEGAHDALAFDRVSAPAVALVSAAFTARHARVLSTVTSVSRITLAFDGDATGRAAVVPAATVLLAHGFAPAKIDVIDSNDGGDPDDLEPEELAARWAEPLSLVDFCLRHGELSSASQRVALLATLPPTQAGPLREEWGIDEDSITRQRRRNRKASTPAQHLAQALLSDPSHASALARAEVEAALAHDPLTLRKLSGLAFADATDASQLPPPVRAHWLACQVAHVSQQSAAHEAGDPFANGGGHEDFKAWMSTRESLRKQARNLRAELAKLNASE